MTLGDFMKYHETVNIYVSTIKTLQAQLPSNYEPIQAGGALNSPLCYIRDDSGQNISHKNKTYCELTVLYWMWKNQQYDITGLTHHRRFFFNQCMFPHILRVNEIHSILRKHDIIIPKAISVGQGVESQYKKAHIGADYDLCREVVGTMTPEYLPSFDKNSTSLYLHPYNMLITRASVLNDYCSFLFPLLERLEKQIDVDSRIPYQQRVFGFLAERLFQVWLLKNQHLKSIELPVYNLDKSIIKQKRKEIL